MAFLRLALRNLLRHWLRTVLTVLSLVVALFLLVVLRTLVTTLESGEARLSGVPFADAVTTGHAGLALADPPLPPDWTRNGISSKALASADFVNATLGGKSTRPSRASSSRGPHTGASPTPSSP